MTEEVEEEWERVDSRIQAFTDAKVTSNSTGGSIPMPTRSLCSVDDNVRFKIPIVPPVTIVNDPIDDALLSAVTNPRERLLLLNMEHQILEFMKSVDVSKTFPPNLNSFRRLLLHRLAARFRLSRSTVDDFQSIVLTKNADIIIPHLLLVDIPFDPKTELSVEGSLTRDPSYNSLTSEDTSFFQNPGDVDPSQKLKDVAPSSSHTQKKVVMMRRDNSGDKKSNKKEKQSKQLSQVAADKAKQYAEAKARIFGSDTVDDGTLMDASMVTEVILSNSASPSLSPELVATSATTQSIHSTQSSKSQSSKSQSINQTNVNKFGAASGVAHKTSSSKGKKAVERDRGADEKDPDFLRRSYGSHSGSAGSLGLPNNYDGMANGIHYSNTADYSSVQMNGSQMPYGSNGLIGNVNPYSVPLPPQQYYYDYQQNGGYVSPPQSGFDARMQGPWMTLQPSNSGSMRQMIPQAPYYMNPGQSQPPNDEINMYHNCYNTPGYGNQQMPSYSTSSPAIATNNASILRQSNSQRNVTLDPNDFPPLLR